MLHEEDLSDILSYNRKEMKLYNIDEAGQTIQKCKVNGIEMTIHEFRKSREAKIGNTWHNRRLGVPQRD